MAVTTAFSGTHVDQPSFRFSLSGDATGTEIFEDPLTTQWDAAGGDVPTGTAAFKGTATITGAQDLLLADATDPLQGTGAGSWSRDAAVSGVLKLKYLRIRIVSGAKLTVARGAANGLPIFSAAGDGLQFGKLFEWFDDDGAVTGVVTTGASDKVTCTPSTGTVVAVVLTVWGA
jgi:hypothetical protein